VQDEPVRVGVACSGCGAKRRIKVTELARAGACSRCGEGARRVDRGGGSAHPVYTLWASMRHRCGPTAGEKTRRRYLDRGITVCPEWAESYETFRDWALVSPGGWRPGLQLDRRDNDRGYSPDNCRWVTRLENHDNRETTRRVTAWGETKLLVAWTDDPRCVVEYAVAYERLYRARPAWEPERALSTPRRQRKDNRAKPAYVPGRRP
jgi:hypothetical protein